MIKLKVDKFVVNIYVRWKVLFFWNVYLIKKKVFEIWLESGRGKGGRGVIVIWM